MHRLFSTLWILLCLLSSPSGPGIRSAQADTLPPPIKKILLTDGVRLILKPETETDWVVLTVFVREEAPATGQEAAIRCMVNAALFYGSVNRSYEATSASVAQTGGVLRTRQTPDYVAVTCITSNAQVREAIYLLSEAIKNADFSPEALERARQSLLRQRTERTSDPFLAIYDGLTQSFRGHIQPNPVELRHVTQDQATAYFRSHFVPARTVAVVAGRFDSALVERSFDNNLFDYERPGQRLPASPPIRPVQDAALPTLATTAIGAASYALIAVQAPTVVDPDYPAFAVLSTLLGEGHASRMFRDIREKSGYGYNVGSSLRVEEDNPLVAYIEWESSPSSEVHPPEVHQPEVHQPGIQPSGVHQPGVHPLTKEVAIQLITDQLDNLAAHPPTDAELQRARNFTIGQYVLRHERLQERAFLPGWYEVMGLGFDFDTELPRRIASVTREDIARVVKLYLSQRQTGTALPSQSDH